MDQFMQPPTGMPMQPMQAPAQPGGVIPPMFQSANPASIPGSMGVNPNGPSISIILPAYNAHNTIKRCLSSIAMQENIGDIEVVIADDCSSVGYEHIAEQFKHMMQIRIVRMKKNGGPGAARQVGLDYARGQYIMWMDADDTLVSADTMKTLRIVMDQQNMDCVYGRFLEENENGAIYPHELHMVWVFGKLYRRSFLERYNIRFNTSLSNEDTGFNCVVKGCSDKIWFIPKDVYIWHFKPNSITRIKSGMYGQDSGYKGWSDNMAWQILELQKRFVNRNYILSEIIGNMVTHYCFHEENLCNYPMNAEISLNWCRGFYHNVYEPNMKYITTEMFNQIASQTLAGHNISAKGIIPSMSLAQFMKEMKKPVQHLPNEETCGATPAGYIPPITSKDWPVEVKDYFDFVEPPLAVNSDTNHSRYGGMKKAIGVALNDDDYDMEYTGEGGGGNTSDSYADHICDCGTCERCDGTCGCHEDYAVSPFGEVGGLGPLPKEYISNENPPAVNELASTIISECVPQLATKEAEVVDIIAKAYEPTPEATEQEKAPENEPVEAEQTAEPTEEDAPLKPATTVDLREMAGTPAVAPMPSADSNELPPFSAAWHP